MASVLMHNWWALALRGAVGIAFGLLSLAMPGATLLAMAMLVGGFALADGALAIAAAVRRRREHGDHWWSLLLSGLLGVAAGLILLLNPGFTALALVYLVAAWAMVTGVLSIVAAIKLREQIEGEWLLGVTGILWTLLGVAMFVFPRTAALAIVFWVGASAIVAGVMLIVLALRLRRAGRAAGVLAG